ncbi:hypothetical protein [Planctobacterium marinum]|uniref:Uncharacterized protein n=1 Tax=Planctobacterium marinum TaxID=1631968 RepID=A0AA48KSE9_9ALTE|nr:hypothetical protein MACH26_40590 [Planctobacterium marinum]
MRINDTESKISLSTLDVLFWMLDDSHLKNLQEKSTKVLTAAFGTIEEARRYRSEAEAQQFTLSHICSNGTSVRSIPQAV